MPGLTPKNWLEFTVLAAIVSTGGNLLATVLKEYLFARSFEKWKDHRSLMSVYHKYRDPVMLAAKELGTRLDQIEKAYPPDYLCLNVLQTNPPELKSNSAEDPHFKKYRLLSTVYRLCAFLGWLEIYRQEVTFLDTGQQGDNRRLQTAIDLFRNDLAEGGLNEAKDFFKWRDALIFREEQRATGELMITVTAPRSVIGYGTFCTLFERSVSEQYLWPLRTACGFFLDMEKTKDFRRERQRLMLRHLNEIVDVLRPGSATVQPIIVYQQDVGSADHLV